MKIGAKVVKINHINKLNYKVMKTNPVNDCKITHSWNNLDYVVNLHFNEKMESYVIMCYDVDLEDWEEIETIDTELNAVMVFYQTILECLGEKVYFTEN